MANSTNVRDASQTPFASDSVFNLPIGSNAQWQYNGQLAGANVFVNTTMSGYTENIYTGTASDQLVTVTNYASAGGTAGTFQVHIPSGALAASGGDQTFSVDDTTTGTWYSFGGFQWNGGNTATAQQGSGESDSGSGIAQDGSNWDQGVGTLRQSDIEAGTIDHMLRVELPTTTLASYSSSAYQLAPYAWPQTQEDGSGPSIYSGTVPYGVTIGIPADAVEPADVANNAGANMLWTALRNHGAMVRDSGSFGNVVTFQADQNVAPADPLTLGMDQYGSEIMAQVRILTNQGPNSVNGGGTPIVPLDPPVGGGQGGGGSSTVLPTPTATVTATATATATVTGTPAATPTRAVSAASTQAGATSDGVLTPTSGGSIQDGSGATWSLSSAGVTIENGNLILSGSDTAKLTGVSGVIWGQSATSSEWYTFNGGYWTAQGAAVPSAASASTNTSASSGTTGSSDPASGTITISGGTVNATSGDQMLFITGASDTLNLGGGVDTVSDNGGGGNIFVLPAAGKGSVVFNTDVLGNGDKLDLTAALGQTGWDGSSQTLGAYLQTSQAGGDTQLLISANGSGSGTVLATFKGESLGLSAIIGQSIT